MNKPFVRMYNPEQDEGEVLSLPLRQADQDELRAAYGMPPEVVLKESLKLSELTWVIMYEDHIIGIFGVTRHISYPDVGIPWLLATDELTKIQYTFAKVSKDVVDAFAAGHPILTNIVDSRHKEAINWLKWLGFTIDPEVFIMYDPDVSFHMFYKITEKKGGEDV